MRGDSAEFCLPLLTAAGAGYAEYGRRARPMHKAAAVLRCAGRGIATIDNLLARDGRAVRRRRRWR
ncbi:MAG: hypothetical protein ACLUI3_11830 [Christensenellales bacterium]